LNKCQTQSESERDWCAVAAAVLRGSWNRATSSEQESIAIGLRRLADTNETCAKALKKIDTEGKFNLTK
jgi:hypothetical protein